MDKKDQTTHPANPPADKAKYLSSGRDKIQGGEDILFKCCPHRYMLPYLHITGGVELEFKDGEFYITLLHGVSCPDQTKHSDSAKPGNA